ncbi:class I SAM-dependent methyltransferase [Halochromatium roseum]|uniref:class I SAM-dependent methyltransferase n=1 Tax=Halochromatium roseum TaxID=391920 RepID=UPI00191255E7|nr:methyltransferase domain-containing protein [Halochromatium roseum]MBK5940691.1 SAM-dependent methyltransferase [Halochromatium roseum]
MPHLDQAQQANAPATRSRAGETFRYINWLFNPYQRLDVPAIYDLLSTRAATERALYLNLGYWRDATDLDSASNALADLLADAAQLSPGDQLLDVGYGFADQDMRWSERYQPAQIIGLNLTQSQVEIARQRVAERGLSEQIDLRQGSATAMDLPDASVDKVIALECAFHFRSREQFLREAFRVLRPGGRIAIADILPRPAQGSAWQRFKRKTSWALVAGKFSIPWDNAYPIPTYHAKLKLRGYEQIRVESIRDQVYAPLHHWLRAHRDSLQRLHPVARFAAKLALRRAPETLYAGLDYVVATAVKPVR